MIGSFVHATSRTNRLRASIVSLETKTAAPAGSGGAQSSVDSTWIVVSSGQVADARMAHRPR